MAACLRTELPSHWRVRVFFTACQHQAAGALRTGSRERDRLLFGAEVKLGINSHDVIKHNISTISIIETEFYISLD